MKLIVDTREAAQQKKLVEALKIAGADITEQLLPVGDWMCPSRDNLLLERKTVVDFLSSAKDGRLWNQLKMMLDSEGIRPALLLEGPLTLVERFTHWNPNSVAGIITSVVLEYNVPIIPSPNKQWTFRFLSTMAKDREGSKIFPVRFAAKGTELWKIQRGLVESLPGISAVLSENLLSTFKSPMNVFKAKEDELMFVNGVGDKKAKRIREALDGEYKK